MAITNSVLYGGDAQMRVRMDYLRHCHLPAAGATTHRSVGGPPPILIQ